MYGNSIRVIIENNMELVYIDQFTLAEVSRLQVLQRGRVFSGLQLKPPVRDLDAYHDNGDKHIDDPSAAKY
jgi:hypothetical protein